MKSDCHRKISWDGKERRAAFDDRRRSSDRRALLERRHDVRTERILPRRSLKCILKALTNARLGVDRRKEDRRHLKDRRSLELRSLLTPQELADLLE